jgi:hypothetical protein
MSGKPLQGLPAHLQIADAREHHIPVGRHGVFAAELPVAQHHHRNHIACVQRVVGRLRDKRRRQ